MISKFGVCLDFIVNFSPFLRIVSSIVVKVHEDIYITVLFSTGVVPLLIDLLSANFFNLVVFVSASLTRILGVRSSVPMFWLKN